MTRPNAAVAVCAIATVLFFTLAFLFVLSRHFRFALGAFLLALACLGFGISEARHAARDARLKREPFTTPDFPPQPKRPIR